MNAAHKQAGLFLRIAQRDRRAFEKLMEGSSEEFPVAAFLAQQVLATGAELPVSLEDLLRLTPYAVAFRYDDTLIPLLTPEKARDMVDRCIAWCENRLALA